MTRIVAIVEGDGEVAALPVLLCRIGNWLTPALYSEVVTPIRVRRDRFLNVNTEFRRILQLASAKCDEDGWILILLDADDDCPASLAPSVFDRANEVVPHRRVSVVLANCEYEAWFIAAATSLNGLRGFILHADDRPDAESIRSAKEWLSMRIPDGKYREVTDQPAFSATVDLVDARAGSRSFRKLCTEWQKNMAVVQMPPDS